MSTPTHAVSPLIKPSSSDTELVACFGSGIIRKKFIKCHNSLFAFKTTLIRFKNSDLAAVATLFLYDTVKQYIESFDIYGNKLSFEWNRLDDKESILFTGKEDARHLKVPDTSHMLPLEIAKFTKVEEASADQDMAHLSFIQGAGHGGSHPHIAHEFISAIIEGRDSVIDADTGANWTCTGICSHESAMKGGE